LVFSARVLRAKASEPDAGSDRQKEPTVFVERAGMNFSF
jgi:hypothetical protein